MALKDSQQLLQLATAANDDEIRCGCPRLLKEEITKAAAELRMTAPKYVRYVLSLAVVERNSIH